MYKVGTPVLHIPCEPYSDDAAIGVIIEVNPELHYPYRIVFHDDDDWFTNEEGDVTEMVEAYREHLMRGHDETQSRDTCIG